MDMDTSYFLLYSAKLKLVILFKVTTVPSYKFPPYFRKRINFVLKNSFSFCGDPEIDKSFDFIVKRKSSTESTGGWIE